MRTLSLAEALDWAEKAKLHDYLIYWDDSPADDPGNRGGFDDSELAQIESALAERDLTLATDDVGTYAARR